MTSELNSSDDRDPPAAADTVTDTANPATESTAFPPPTATADTGSPSPRGIMYRLWNGVYPASVCQAVIDTFDDNAFYEAHVQTAKGEALVDERTRKTKNMFIEPGHWTGALVSHFAHQANLLWKYDIAGLGTLSILRYDEAGHFDWHVDVLSYEPSNYPGLGNDLERKLSVTINLSDPGDYEGGDLEFLNGIGQLLTQPELRERGSIVVFPSTLGHRVTPLTNGVRYALVGWMVGPPIR